MYTNISATNRNTRCNYLRICRVELNQPFKLLFKFTSLINSTLCSTDQWLVTCLPINSISDFDKLEWIYVCPQRKTALMCLLLLWWVRCSVHRTSSLKINLKFMGFHLNFDTKYCRRKQFWIWNQLISLLIFIKNVSLSQFTKFKCKIVEEPVRNFSYRIQNDPANFLFV